MSSWEIFKHYLFYENLLTNNLKFEDDEIFYNIWAGFILFGVVLRINTGTSSDDSMFW